MRHLHLILAVVFLALPAPRGDDKAEVDLGPIKLTTLRLKKDAPKYLADAVEAINRERRSQCREHLETSRRLASEVDLAKKAKIGRKSGFKNLRARQSRIVELEKMAEAELRLAEKIAASRSVTVGPKLWPGKYKLGQVGQTIGETKVFQVIGVHSLLAMQTFAKNSETLWISMPTKGIVDDKILSLDDVYVVTGIHEYESRGSGMKTVFVLERLNDILEMCE